MTIAPNDIDLTTADAVIQHLGLGGSNFNPAIADNIQVCITAASMYWLRICNKEMSADGKSPFVIPCAYNEWYDGTGSPRMFLRQTPINSIQSLTMNGVAIPVSQSFGQYGCLVHEDERSIIIRAGGGSTINSNSMFSSRAFFIKGMMNINVLYTAGYVGVPFDVEEKCRIMVAVNYKRRNWIDYKTQSLPQSGTVTYRDWIVPPDVTQVMKYYSRTAVV